MRRVGVVGLGDDRRRRSDHQVKGVIKSKLGEPGMDDEKQGSHIAVQSAYLPISASTSRIVDATNSISFAASRLCWLVLVLALTLSPPSPKSIFRGIGFAVDSLNPLFLFFFLNLITSSLVIYAPSALVGRSRAFCLPFPLLSAFRCFFLETVSAPAASSS